jgi:hypothetical protein
MHPEPILQEARSGTVATHYGPLRIIRYEGPFTFPPNLRVKPEQMAGGGKALATILRVRAVCLSLCYTRVVRIVVSRALVVR